MSRVQPDLPNDEDWRKAQMITALDTTPNATDLRDLALKIEDLCRSHRAYSQAWRVIQNASDHLQAMANCCERNQISTGKK